MMRTFLRDLVIWPTVLIVYFLPLYVGLRRHVRGRNLALLAAVNTVAGWTGWGWLVAMGIALREVRPAPAAHVTYTTQPPPGSAPEWTGSPRL